MLKVSGRMNGSYSNMFNITRGTRQGSVLTPRFFCIFLNSLLVDLECSNAGVCIGTDSYQSFAYADDINLFSVTVDGLQSLIDICLAYSKKGGFVMMVKMVLWTPSEYCYIVMTMALDTPDLIL